MARHSTPSRAAIARNGKHSPRNIKNSVVGSNTANDDDTRADDVVVVSAYSSENTDIPPILVCLFVAFLSFGAGVLTPSILPISRKFHPQQSKVIEQRRAVVQATKTVRQPLFSCNSDLLSQFLHDEPVPGLHLVCLEENGNNSINIKLFPESSNEAALVAAVSKQWNSLRSQLIETLKLRPTDELHIPWAAFSPVGEWLADEIMEEDNTTTVISVIDTLVRMGVVLIFQGGQWIWPGVRIGFQRQVALYSIMPPRSESFEAKEAKQNVSAILETLSLQPLVFSVQGFLSQQECDYVQQLAAPEIKYSGVVLMDKHKDRSASDFRTSQSTFLSADDDEILTDIDHRTASLVRIPRDLQENVQVLRYGIDEHYYHHHDFFAPELYQNDFMTQMSIQKGRRNRMATVFWYLNDVEEGGETIFPRFQNAPPPEDTGDCSTGLKVKPQRGKVIIFYSMTPDGNLDQLSVHGACDVKKGIKWAANKWVWNTPLNLADVGIDDNEEDEELNEEAS